MRKKLRPALQRSIKWARKREARQVTVRKKVIAQKRLSALEDSTSSSYDNVSKKRRSVQNKRSSIGDGGFEVETRSCLRRKKIDLESGFEDELNLKDEKEEGIARDFTLGSFGNAPIACDSANKTDVDDSTEFQATTTLLELCFAAIQGALIVSSDRSQALCFSEIYQKYLEVTIDQDSKELDLEYSLLACSEDLASDDTLDYSSSNHDELSLSQLESELLSKFSDLESPYFSLSMLINSLNDSSQESDGDSPPPVYFFLQHLKDLFKCDSSDTQLSPVRQEFYDEYTALFKSHNDEDEETYRRDTELLLFNYNDKYSSTDFADLVLKQRIVMINWIVTQSKSLGLQFETMFLGASLLDRFLSQGFFKHKRKLQVLGIACLALAIKIEENQPYNSVCQTVFYVGKNVYIKSEVIGMEWLVQQVLNLHCFLPTIYNFLGFYLKAANATDEVEKKAKSLAELLLLNHEQLFYWPSTVAAGLVILASLGANQEPFCQWAMENVYEVLSYLDQHAYSGKPKLSYTPDLRTPLDATDEALSLDLNGTTLIGLVEKNTIIIAADTRVTNIKVIQLPGRNKFLKHKFFTHEAEKINQIGHTMLVAIAGSAAQGRLITRFIKCAIAEKSNENGVYKRNWTVNKVAKKAFKFGENLFREPNYRILLAGYDWVESSYTASVYTFTDVELYKIENEFCTSGNNWAMGEGYAFLENSPLMKQFRSGEERLRITVGRELAIGAIRRASEHDIHTGGAVSVYRGCTTTKVLFKKIKGKALDVKTIKEGKQKERKGRKRRRRD